MLIYSTHSFVLKTFIRSPHLLPLAFFIASFCLLQISVATDEESTWDWEPDKYPNLLNKKEAKFCTGSDRNPPSAICDPDTLLEKNDAYALDKLIASLGNTTTCFCPPCPPNKKGLSIKVAMLYSVKRIPNQTMDETIEHFADRTRSNWNFSPVCKHDVLIFVSSTFNKVYISMGSKAERVIGSSEAKEIVKETMNHFKFGHVYQGLESIIASVKYREEVYDPRFDRLGLKHGLFITVGAALASLLVIVIAVWFCIKRETKRTTKINNKKSKIGLDQEYHQVKSDV